MQIWIKLNLERCRFIQVLLFEIRSFWYFENSINFREVLLLRSQFRDDLNGTLNDLSLFSTFSMPPYMILNLWIVCCKELPQVMLWLMKNVSYRVLETASRLQKESTVRLNHIRLLIIQIQYQTGKTIIHSVVKCLHVMRSFPFVLTML